MRGHRVTGVHCRLRAASKPPIAAELEPRPRSRAARAEIEERLNKVRSPFRTGREVQASRRSSTRATRAAILCSILRTWRRPLRAAGLRGAGSPPSPCARAARCAAG
jgi:transposase